MEAHGSTTTGNPFDGEGLTDMIAAWGSMILLSVDISSQS